MELGLRYADGSVKGGNARCGALLHALVAVIRDYTTPEGKSLSRDLTAHINATIAFLVECRPLSVSMGARLGWEGCGLYGLGRGRHCPPAAAACC
jgi:translation initiation factor eIF-2B subunit delta